MCCSRQQTGSRSIPRPGWPLHEVAMALPPTIASNTIVSNISGQTAAPAANTLTQLLDAILGAQPGAIIMRHGASWQALAPGAPGQVLQVQTYMANWGPLSPDVRLPGCRGLCARQHHGPRFHIVDDVAAGSGGLSPADAGSTRRSAMGAAGVGANRCGRYLSLATTEACRRAGCSPPAARSGMHRQAPRPAPTPIRFPFGSCSTPPGPMHRRRSRVVAEPERRPISTPTRQSGFPTFAAGSPPARTTWAALRQAG